MLYCFASFHCDVSLRNSVFGYVLPRQAALLAVSCYLFIPSLVLASRRRGAHLRDMCVVEVRMNSDYIRILPVCNICPQLQWGQK